MSSDSDKTVDNIYTTRDDSWELLKQQQKSYNEIRRQMYILLRFSLTIVGIGIAIASVLFTNFDFTIPLITGEDSWTALQGEYSHYEFHFYFGVGYMIGFFSRLAIPVGICLFILNILMILLKVPKKELYPHNFDSSYKINIKNVEGKCNMGDYLTSWISNNQTHIFDANKSLKEAYQMLSLSMVALLLGLVGYTTYMFAILPLIDIFIMAVSSSMIMILLRMITNPPEPDHYQSWMRFIYPPGDSRDVKFIRFTYHLFVTISTVALIFSLYFNMIAA